MQSRGARYNRCTEEHFCKLKVEYILLSVSETIANHIQLIRESYTYIS